MERVKNQIIKRLMLIALTFISLSASAQVVTFKTTAYAENKYDYYSQRWSGWSDWEASNMLLTIDLQNDIITIYSLTPQVYRIYEAEGGYYDSDGDFNLPFKFVDQDGDRGIVRLLQRTSGSSEIYIEFLNVRWCYKVVGL